MVEDMIDSLKNMKLTAEEEEVIEISDEGRLTEIESCNLSLIGKFLTCKAFTRFAIFFTHNTQYSLLLLIHVQVQCDLAITRFTCVNVWSLNYLDLFLKYKIG